jgi:transposase
LRLIDQTVASEKQIHIICDNYATHKHQRVQRWMARHKRFHVHFTPTSASWLNMIERFFRDLTENRIRRGIFQDLEQLITAIGDYIDRHNDNPKPFIWTAKANDILEKVTRAQAGLGRKISALQRALHIREGYRSVSPEIQRDFDEYRLSRSQITFLIPCRDEGHDGCRARTPSRQM